MKYNDRIKPLQCFMTQSTCYKGTGKMAVKGVLWHSTGANNPTLKRYVQPDDNASNLDKLIVLIGKNAYGNDWNHIYHKAGLNCWIGKLADGTVTTIQTMPWDYRPWGCGNGSKGSCNSGWIQFEICEDDLTDPVYFEKVYDEACAITAYLCKMFGVDPNGTVVVNGVKIPTILCHADSYKLGFGSNHGDVNHWFPKHGKSMATARADVAKLLGAVDKPPVVIAPTPQSTDTAKLIWDFLTKKGLNAYAVAGIMGNLYAESGLKANNLQNSYEMKLCHTDESYTEAVDCGTYQGFVRDCAGYGLAQWTYWSRKQALFDHARAENTSIGSLTMQLDFLWKELQSYTAVMKVLNVINTVSEASNVILLQYEKPADQSVASQQRHAGYGQGYYDKFAVQTPTSPAPTAPTAFAPYLVKVNASTLNVRAQPKTDSKVITSVKNGDVYTIVGESTGTGATKWGKLKSGAGWISLDFILKI